MKLVILSVLIIQILVARAAYPWFLDNNQTEEEGTQRHNNRPYYQDTGATLDNTYHAANCMPTGTLCEDGETCCTKTCRRANGFGDEDACCLPEGSACDSSPKGNPGLAVCCMGTTCMPMMAKGGLGSPKISVCQVKPK